MSKPIAPYVSIIMPIYNRSKWLPLITININNLSYPKDKLEFVILDDSEGDPLLPTEEDIVALQEKIKPVSLKYIRDNNRKSIGAKRNKLVKLSTHKIIACMDSDDLYFPTYLDYSVSELQKNKLSCVGSAEMLFCYPYDDYKVTAIRCKSDRQIHEASMVFTKKHHQACRGFASKGVGEGAQMFDFMNNKKIKQLSIMNIMMCICHQENTCNKDMFKTSTPVNGEIDIGVKKIINNILNIDGIRELNTTTSNEAENEPSPEDVSDTETKG
jgi:glycosyltransferase involved in cell wall biosynthesis